MLLAEDSFLIHFRLVYTAGFVGLIDVTSQSGAGVFGTHAPVGDKKLGDLFIHCQNLK